MGFLAVVLQSATLLGGGWTVSSCVCMNCIDSFILPSPAQGPSGIPTPSPRPGLEQYQVSSHQTLKAASGSM